MSRAVPRNRLLVGDAVTQLRTLPAGSVDMVLTSPPYFRLRDYQIDGQLGLEAHVDQWADQLHAVTRELARVLVPTGTLWLNLGDTYSTHPREGAPAKSLLLGPSRVALRLIDDGWRLRNAMVWHKPNAMPTSVRDRLATTYELVYVFARQNRYFFDLDAIRQPHRSTVRPPRTKPRDPLPASWRGPNSDGADGLVRLKQAGRVGHPLGKNPGDVWAIGTTGFRGAHFATFPLPLADRAIRAGCPERRCTLCRHPWRRQVVRAMGRLATRGALAPTCACGAPSEAGLVLDPFLGAGSTAIAAERLDRDWLGIELNPAFARLARTRIRQHRPRPPSTEAAAA